MSVSKNIRYTLYVFFFILKGFCLSSCHSTLVNTSDTILPDMVYLSGGLMSIDPANTFGGTKNINQRYIAPFFIDKHLVTVSQFMEFVQKTAYVTQAETFGNSIVFDIDSGFFKLAKGAYWKRPLNHISKDTAISDHPVTHISWHDAQAYAQWAGKRLISEFEWAYAAKGSSAEADEKKYHWGDSLVDKQGDFQANVWQGRFPYVNLALDGFVYTSPVGYFGADANGLSDMGGNVWEWCSESYARDLMQKPSYDSIKVLRGGSFLCDSMVCHGYRIGARQSSSSETASLHIGFRCAKDAPYKNWTQRFSAWWYELFI